MHEISYSLCMNNNLIILDQNVRKTLKTEPISKYRLNSSGYIELEKHSLIFERRLKISTDFELNTGKPSLDKL